MILFGGQQWQVLVFSKDSALVWAEVIFSTGWYRTAFCICAELGVDNIEMVLLWLSRAYNKKLFCFSYCHIGKGLEMNGRQGSDTAGTGDLN